MIQINAVVNHRVLHLECHPVDGCRRYKLVARTPFHDARQSFKLVWNAIAQEIGGNRGYPANAGQLLPWASP